MTNITVVFNEYLATHPAVAPIPYDRKPPPPVDEFFKEAYRIESHISSLTTYLLSIRASYLSTATTIRPSLSRTASISSTASFQPQSQPQAPLTDTQRDSIDSETKSVIRESLFIITRLENTLQIQHQTQQALLSKKYRQGFRGIFKDESEVQKEEEDRLKVEAAHRDAVIWWLKDRLRIASEIQRGMQEVRLMRQVERGKSMLNKAPSGMFVASRGGGGGAGDGAGMAATAWSGNVRGVVMEEEEKKGIEQMLSKEQLRIFEKENGELMKHYEDTLDQVRTAEKSLIEISSLQTELATNLASQNAFIDNLIQDSLTTAEDMKKGNKELKKAAERVTVARSAFWGTAIFCGVVFVWDWFI